MSNDSVLSAFPMKDAIQLITAQKAKGSEWDAVIVPVSEPARQPDRRRATRRSSASRERTNSLRLCTRKIAKTKSRSRRRSLRRQEMERLLYVASDARASHARARARSQSFFARARSAAVASRSRISAMAAKAAPENQMRRTRDALPERTRPARPKHCARRRRTERRV